MAFSIPNPTNNVQREFNKYCELGGGVRGGPARGRVQELLRSYGKRLNGLAHEETKKAFSENPGANPWHVCFAVGMVWGHFAQLTPEFIAASIRLMENWNDADLKVAKAYPLEKGTDPIEHSLRGAHVLFQKVVLPERLPDTLVGIARAQDRWLGRILGPDRPYFFGGWNSTAMFMVALFAQPELAKTHLSPPPVLPPGGPIFKGLQYLYQVGILARPPSGSELDNEGAEPGVIYENNALLSEVLKGYPDWSMIDVHSGIYLLGTKHPHADSWLERAV
ncbi:hypothetical protein [Methylosinus sp. PW1]|uniref:hypothetical protein n=1 Tax=Methylosinus sp. PW1 TaxID=107636 RepID=UPI000A04FFBA|nr:hypothetical protein [Methylosinus sp. PW1]